MYYRLPSSIIFPISSPAFHIEAVVTERLFDETASSLTLDSNQPHVNPDCGQDADCSNAAITCEEGVVAANHGSHNPSTRSVTERAR